VKERDTPFSKNVKSFSYDLITNFLGNCFDESTSAVGWKLSIKA